MKEIEIEYKQLLTKEEYQIIEQFLIKKNIKSIDQENYYFDTKDFKLKEKQKALRIRKKENIYEACLKQQREFDILEDNIILSEIEATKMFNNPNLLASAYGLAEKVILLGSLKTSRYEYQLVEGLICLDKSRYLNTEDYEIEFEAIDYHQKQVFIDFLKTFKIEFNENKKSKIARFDELLQQLSYNK